MNNQANPTLAQLRAAAPEMYEALQIISNRTKASGSNILLARIRAIAENALAKAEGRK